MGAGEAGPSSTSSSSGTTLRQLEDDDGFHAAIVDGAAIVGTVGFHRIDRANRATSIGYWIAEASQGRGK